MTLDYILPPSCGAETDTEDDAFPATMFASTLEDLQGFKTVHFLCCGNTQMLDPFEGKDDPFAQTTTCREPITAAPLAACILST